MVLTGVLAPNLDCSTCSDSMKVVRGCEGTPQQPTTLLGKELDRCPMRPYFEAPSQHNDLMMLHRWYKEGYLPDPGQILDQAECFVAAMTVIDSAVAMAEHEKLRKERAAQKTTGRAGTKTQPRRRSRGR